VAAGHVSYFRAKVLLIAAIVKADKHPNEEDMLWIRQGLHDGVRYQADPREDLGKLAHQWCREYNPERYRLSWDELLPEDREVFRGMGSALYAAGFQAGADSVKHE
jgi:hypothetical protein